MIEHFSTISCRSDITQSLVLTEIVEEGSGTLQNHDGQHPENTESLHG